MCLRSNKWTQMIGTKFRKKNYWKTQWGVCWGRALRTPTVLFCSGYHMSKYHRVHGLNNRNFFSLFWRLEVQDQGTSAIDFC
jgi:hypothetical protein